MRFRGLKILLLAVTAAAVLFLLCGAVKTLGMDRWVDFDVYRITGCDRTSIIYDGQSDVVTRLHGSSGQSMGERQQNHSQALCMLLSPPKTRDFLSTRE